MYFTVLVLVTVHGHVEEVSNVHSETVTIHHQLTVVGTVLVEESNIVLVVLETALVVLLISG